MSITGLEFETEAEHEQFQECTLPSLSSQAPNSKIEVKVIPTNTTDFGFEEEALHEQLQHQTSADVCSQS